jgi:hypothetical protein
LKLRKCGNTVFLAIIKFENFVSCTEIPCFLNLSVSVIFFEKNVAAFYRMFRERIKLFFFKAFLIT